MAKLMVKSFEKPDERRKFVDHGWVDSVKFEGREVGRGTFLPGWRWSSDVKPISGTDSCKVGHRGYILSGRMMIKMDDGDQAQVGPGDSFVIPPGHDAWVVGDEACVMVDFGEDVVQYAKPAEHEVPAPH